MMRKFITFLSLLPISHQTYFLTEDRVCDPGGENLLFPYTGFRLQRQYTYGFPMLHHVRLSHCDNGIVDMESFLITDRNTDFVWATNMCTSSQMCFRAVRKKKYATRNMNIFIPYTVVGGLFMCPGNDTECTNENARPVLPLIADRVWLQWYHYPKYRRVVQRIPYFSTPNYIDPRYPHRQDKGAEWASKLDINEAYIYTARDSFTISTVANTILNLINDMFKIKPGHLLWERDPIVKELKKDINEPLAPKIIRKLTSFLITTQPNNKFHKLLTLIESELEPLETINDENIKIQHGQIIDPNDI